eukprot:3186116-Pleurochrysis_carterae.AAC.2
MVLVDMRRTRGGVHAARLEEGCKLSGYALARIVTVQRSHDPGAAGRITVEQGRGVGLTCSEYGHRPTPVRIGNRRVASEEKARCERRKGPAMSSWVRRPAYEGL